MDSWDVLERADAQRDLLHIKSRWGVGEFVNKIVIFRGWGRDTNKAGFMWDYCISSWQKFKKRFGAK